MKNTFIKPEAEILTFLCNSVHRDADSVDQVAKLGEGKKINKDGALPIGNPDRNGVAENGGDLGVPYQNY